MNNYIGKIDAEWVDPAVELPPDGWRGMIVWKGNGEQRMGHWSGMEWRSPGAEPFRYYLNEIVAWLRIGGPTDAVPRAAVQAAVDRLFESSVLSDCECPTCDAIRELADALGVTPKERE